MSDIKKDEEKVKVLEPTSLEELNNIKLNENDMKKEVKPGDLFEITKIDSKTFYSNIDNYRITFLKKYKIYSVIFYSIIFIVFACLITGIILFSLSKIIDTLYILIPFSLGLISVITYFVLNRIVINKSLLKNQRQYFVNYSNDLIRYEYGNNENIKQKSFILTPKIETSYFQEGLYFKNVVASTCRNYFKGTINNKEFIQLDCTLAIPPLDNSLEKKLIDATNSNLSKKEIRRKKSLQKYNDENMLVAMYGRMYNFNYKLDKNNCVFITFKSDFRQTYLPTNLDIVSKCNNLSSSIKDEKYKNLFDKEIIVYGSNKEVVEKVLLNNTKLIELLKNHIPFSKEYLQSMFMSLTDNGIYIYANLNEEVIALPLKEGGSKNYIETLCNLDNYALSIFDAVSNNGTK